MGIAKLDQLLAYPGDFSDPLANLPADQRVNRILVWDCFDGDSCRADVRQIGTNRIFG